MNVNLTGKTILIVGGSLLSADALQAAFTQAGARVHLTGNALTAFDLIGRKHFDGAVLDQGLHNEVFDLCEELRALKVPYICGNAPHRLQGAEARRREAEHTVWRLHDVMQAATVPDAHVIATNSPIEARTR